MAFWIVQNDRLRVGTRVGDLWVAEAVCKPSPGDQISASEAIAYNERTGGEPLPVPPVPLRWWMRLVGAQLPLPFSG
jgi:hypothetical protein